MGIAKRVLMWTRNVALAIGLIAGSVVTVTAQQAEISSEHLSAAKATMKTLGVSGSLNNILPEIASFTKAGLITNRPDIELQISTIVDEAAISLASRRGPLENEVATVYAKNYTLDELQQMQNFFSSDAGKKFLGSTPLILRQVDEISAVWRAGITRDLGELVQNKMTEQGLQ